LREARVFIERTSVGLDVHARSIVACGLDAVTGQVMRRRLVPSAEAVLDWLRELPTPAAVAYEAGPTGFGLARQLSAAGVPCVVAAPSKLTRPAGDRIKTDARDALLLARLLRMDDGGGSPSIGVLAVLGAWTWDDDCRSLRGGMPG
jgi:transposase